MSISITAQPTSNGKYSAYLPIKFTATETANPEFLYFKIRKSDGTPIPEIPFYKAYKIMSYKKTSPPHYQQLHYQFHDKPTLS
jgi:hypothetical protein